MNTILTHLIMFTAVHVGELAVIDDGSDDLPEFPVEAVRRDQLLTEIGCIEKSGLLVAWFEHNLSGSIQFNHYQSHAHSTTISTYNQCFIS